MHFFLIKNVFNVEFLFRIVFLFFKESSFISRLEYSSYSSKSCYETFPVGFVGNKDEFVATDDEVSLANNANDLYFSVGGGENMLQKLLKLNL